MITDRENRFLEELGITPGPWDTTEGVHLTSDKSKYGIATFNKGKDCLFVSKTIAFFMNCFVLCYSIKLQDKPIIYTEIIKDIESATGKTWTELCQLWEDTE